MYQRETGPVKGPVSFYYLYITLKTTLKIIAASVIVCGAFLGACQKEEAKPKAPEKTPEQVVIRFFELLATGGKLTLKEAHQMISNRHGEVDANTFRKWTQDYSAKTKIKIRETVMPDRPNKSGDYVATVKMDVLTPSSFGGDFTTSSQMNLILDEDENVWKIDFLAETVDEEDFRKAPKEAVADVLQENK